MSGNEISTNPHSDFNRRACSILGLPIDILTMQETVERVYSAIDAMQPCFISTPNLNFLIASRKSTSFRASVINSELSLADGMPLLWIAKLLRIPLTKRVAGSSLIEALIHSESRRLNPVKVYFLGGQGGVADQACEKLAEGHSGLRCVGSLNPGFGSVRDMSTPDIIETINQSGAEFIIVSLGAQKGQAWIEHNRHNLDAPVVSHLGAVVNFVAGTVIRAPDIWQRLNVEWLWRIKEEPSLWKRYFSDGLGLVWLLITRVFPYAAIIFRNRKWYSNPVPVTIQMNQHDGEMRVVFHGTLVEESLEPVRDAFNSLCGKRGKICLDLGDVSYIDPFFIAQVLLLYKKIGSRLRIASNSRLIIRILNYNDLSFLLK